MPASRLSLTTASLFMASLLFSSVPPMQAATGSRQAAQTPSSQDAKSKLDELLNEAADLRQKTKWQELTGLAEEAIKLSREIDDESGIAKSLFYLGTAHYYLSRFKAAIETYKQAIPLLEKTEEEVFLGVAYQNMGAAFGSLAYFEEMLEYQIKARAVFRQAGERTREAQVTANTGIVYFELGDYDRADEVFQDALRLARDLKNKDLQARFLSLLGILEHRRARYAPAISYSKESLALNTELNHDGRRRENFQNLAHCYQEMGDHKEAMENYHQAIALARKMGSPYSDAVLSADSATVLLEQGRFSEALDILTRSRAVVHQFGDARAEGETYTRIGRAYRALSRNEEAIASYREALAIIRGFRASAFPSESLRAGKSALGRETFIEAVDLIVSLNREAEALKVAEDYRARAFLDQLAESRVDARQDLPESDRAREDDLLNRISAIQKQLFQENVGPERERQLKAELAAAENELEAFQLEMRRTSPRYANVQHPETLDVEAIQKGLLDADTVLVEIMLGEDRSFAWAVTQSKLRVALLPPRKQIEEAVAAYRSLLIHRASALTLKGSLAEIRAQGRKLYDMLLSPVGSVLATNRRLIIVPDGALAYLPFETLIAVKEKPSQRPEYLLERFAIGYAPSATALAAIRKSGKPSAGQKPLLALGDAVYREDKVNTGRDASAGTRASDKARAADFDIERGFDLTNLPYTRAEVTSIAAIYPAGTSKVYIGSEASEEAIKTERLDQYRYIHFATHGLINEKRPARSALVLSFDNRSKQDGVLQVGEIMRLKLNAEMVTLSACSTGLGKLVDGEGFLGLTRAFFYAGANSVVASLWNVNDASTAKVMKSFYQALSRGVPKDEALRQAKLTMIRGRQQSWQHPYFWAAFVLLGGG